MYFSKNVLLLVAAFVLVDSQLNNVRADPCSTLDNTTLLIDGKCFKLFNILLNWQSAQDYCYQNFYAGTLAEPITQKEMTGVNSFVQSAITGSYLLAWIGANDIALEGHFVWPSDNSSMVPYLWGSKPPDNTKTSLATENCAQIAATKSLTYINDAFCSSRNAFICQSDPCDAFFPGSLFGYGKCYKYYNSAVSWQSAQEYCLSLNSHLAEPETSQVQELLNVYLYNTTAWIGGITINCSKSFQWYVSGNLVSGNFSRFVEGSCLNNSLLMSNVANISSLKARDGQETHGFVCQKAIIATDQQVYVAVFPRLLKTSLQGLLQVTSNFNDVVYVRFKVNSDITSDALTINPLTPGTAVNFYVGNNIILGSTGIYTRYVEVNSSQPVTVVLYIMDQSTISSTLLYPIQMYSFLSESSYLPLSTSFYNASTTSLTVTSMSSNSNNISLFFHSETRPLSVWIGNMTISLSIVDNMTAVLESLYQTLSINLQTNLDGTYLYSTEPVILTLGATGIPMAADTTLDDVLPMAYIGSDYVSFPFRIPDSETQVQLQAVNNWTLITALCSNRTILLEYVGDTYSFLLDTACYIRGNRSLYVYQILSKPTYSQQELCVTSLLASSHWRYEYTFAKVSDIYTVNIYIIAEVNSSSDIVTNDMSVQWTCQNITGTNLLGCDTTLLSHVTYLHIQLANTQRRFGAYVIGYASTSSFCHPMGIKDAAQTSNLELFQHKSYLQSIRNGRPTSCQEERDTTSDSSSQSTITEMIYSTQSLNMTPEITTIADTTTQEKTTLTTQTQSNTSHDVSTKRTLGNSTTTPISSKAEIDAIVSYLTVNQLELSSYKRSLICAPDSRRSAQVCGGTGIIILSSVLFMLVISDLAKVVKYFIAFLRSF
ncbi:macrophage mannose receptor 1 isoform X2 [Biomphalaria glabrata]|nr:macrophage mannose receptor 1 isoform X2 [Biomphalaria glabrata]